MLATLQSSFRIVCDLFEGFWGEREGICPKVFHDVVKECACIFDHRICALAEGEDTSCHQIVELLRLGGWPGFDVCPLPHNLRGQCPTVSTSYPVWHH